MHKMSFLKNSKELTLIVKDSVMPHGQSHVVVRD